MEELEHSERGGAGAVVGGGIGNGLEREAALGGLDVLEVGAAGAIDIEVDSTHEAAVLADGGAEEEEMGAAGEIAVAAVDALGEEGLFLIGEMVEPEDLESEVVFEGAADGVGGIGGDAQSLLVVLKLVVRGDGVLVGVGAVDATVAGGDGFAYGRAGACGFSGVGAIGGEFPF